MVIGHSGSEDLQVIDDFRHLPHVDDELEGVLP